jgi:hypothetical protein
MKQQNFTENQIFQNNLFMGKGIFMLLLIKPSKSTAVKKMEA